MCGRRKTCKWFFYDGEPADSGVLATNTVESVLNLDNPNGWSVVTNAPGLFDFQYAVTNSMDGDQRFFRLRKQ